MRHDAPVRPVPSSPAVPDRQPARPRDRRVTEQRILAAVGEVLARDGFARLGVDAIARAAGVDKVLICRYFGGLPELLRTWGSSGHFWPRVSDLLGADPRDVLDLPEGERYARFLEHFIDALRARPLTLEILAAELQDRNELTAILEAEREAWGEEAARVLGGPACASQPHLAAVTIVLVAGVQYLMLRARRLRVFGGLDLQSDAAWDEIKQALRALAGQIMETAKPPRTSPSS